MTNLASILDEPFEEPAPPKPLPSGSYESIIVGKPTEGIAKTGTPFIEVLHRFIAPMKDVDEAALAIALGDRALTDVVMRNPLYMTDAAKFRIDQLIKDCGFEPDGSIARREYLDQLDGKTVGVFVRHTPRTDGQGIVARIDRTFAI